MRRSVLPATLVVTLLASSAVIAGCGGSGKSKLVVNHQVTVTGAPTNSPSVAVLGFPSTATKNTTRVDGDSAIQDAAGVAQAVYPALTRATRPPAVTIAPTDDWEAALASAVLMSSPIHAPILLSGAGSLPASTSTALSALKPTGHGVPRGAQVITVGDVPKPGGLRSASITAANPFALAAAINTFQTAVAGKPSADVIVASASSPAYAMPAAGYAAESGDPILFVTATSVPQATRQAILARGHPHIYVLGPRA